MLKKLTADQAHQIAALAKAARQARDTILDNVPDEDFGVPPVARGEHNPTASLGFDPLPADDPTRVALRQAVSSLSSESRSELYVLMRMGQGAFAILDWDRALSEAALLGDETVTGAILEEPDLHNRITKGLYEIGYSA
jgi:hypothetical protein